MGGLGHILGYPGALKIQYPYPIGSNRVTRHRRIGKQFVGFAVSALTLQLLAFRQ